MERIADVRFQGGEVELDEKGRIYRSDPAELDRCQRCREKQFMEFEEDRRR